MKYTTCNACVICGQFTDLTFQSANCLGFVLFVRACTIECAILAFAEQECIYVLDELGFA
ncbi:MAG: hypothetical protein UZ19_OD1000662 [Parcubacteria bacterium OLB19]|nr:MAG: hypothetical protein UZ19_OD1000662 [Parcubacteria bacterium OLB19]